MDPEIGELKLVMKSWASATDDVKFTDVRQRACTRADFINPEDASKKSEYGFYPIDQATRDILDSDVYDLRCFDKDSVAIFGDFNTSKANHLMVTFEKCVPTETVKCKSEEAIEKFLSESYILVVENEEIF